MKITTLLFLLLLQLYALELDERDDYSAVSVMTLQGVTSDSIMNKSSDHIELFWVYSTLPSISIGKKSFYLAIEAELFHRQLNLNGFAQERPTLQRYGLFGGVPVIEGGKSTGSVFLGLGLASDFTTLSSKDLYWQIIYDHRVTLSPKLTIGMGILYSHTLGAPKKSSPVNLLPTLRWRMHDRLKLSMNWDNLEFRYFLTERIALVGEGRYDMSWFHCRDFAYQREDVSAGGGIDIKIAKSLFLRGRAYRGLYSREIIWNKEREDIYVPDDGAGFIARFTLSYVR